MLPAVVILPYTLRLVGNPVRLKHSRLFALFASLKKVLLHLLKVVKFLFFLLLLFRTTKQVRVENDHILAFFTTVSSKLECLSKVNMWSRPEST